MYIQISKFLLILPQILLVNENWTTLDTLAHFSFNYFSVSNVRDIA